MHTWPLMSRPSGSSAAVRMTVCLRNGGSASYALRLFPSVLSTMTPVGSGAAVVAASASSRSPSPLSLSSPLHAATSARASAATAPVSVLVCLMVRVVTTHALGVMGMSRPLVVTMRSMPSVIEGSVSGSSTARMLIRS